MRTTKRIFKYFKDQDDFGFKINLNISGHESHQTLIGAFFSILIKFFLVYYFASHVVTMITHGDDKILS